MATLDISGALQAMVSANSPAVRMENNLATAMFSGQVNSVVDGALDKLEASAKSVTELVKSNAITPEQGQIIITGREMQLANAQRFASRFFG